MPDSDADAFRVRRRREIRFAVAGLSAAIVLLIVAFVTYVEWRNREVRRLACDLVAYTRTGTEPGDKIRRDYDCGPPFPRPTVQSPAASKSTPAARPKGAAHRSTTPAARPGFGPAEPGVIVAPGPASHSTRTVHAPGSTSTRTRTVTRAPARSTTRPAVDVPGVPDPCELLGLNVC